MDRVANACLAVFDEIEAAGGSGDQLYLGFSGGMDSTVLLHALVMSDPQGRFRSRITAVHVDHGLAVQSAHWRDHCESVARQLGVSFLSMALRLEPGANLEARARNGRYSCFRELLDSGDRLLLAHHRDDQDESTLLHLLQGRGLYGMPDRRPLGAGTLLRPLLELPRSALENYARAQGLDWLEDPSNRDLRMDRNFLRQSVLPILETRFPALSQRLGRVRAHVEDMDRALVEALDLARNPLPLSVLDGLSAPAAVSVLRRWLIRQEAAASVSDQALADFLAQLQAANDRQPSLAVAAGTLRRYRRLLYLCPTPPELALSYPLLADEAGSNRVSLILPHGEIELSGPEEGEGLVIEVNPPVSVTFAGQLARGLTLNVNGQKRKVRELMRNAGLPPWERETYPLLVDADGLLGVPGVAVRDPTPGTHRRRFRVRWWSAGHR